MCECGGTPFGHLTRRACTPARTPALLRSALLPPVACLLYCTSVSVPMYPRAKALPPSLPDSYSGSLRNRNRRRPRLRGVAGSQWASRRARRIRVGQVLRLRKPPPEMALSNLYFELGNGRITCSWRRRRVAAWPWHAGRAEAGGKRKDGWVPGVLRDRTERARPCSLSADACHSRPPPLSACTPRLVRAARCRLRTLPDVVRCALPRPATPRLLAEA